MRERLAAGETLVGTFLTLGSSAAADERTLGIIQVEHPGAVEAAEDIAALDAADVLFVGPTDLSYAMGIPRQLDHPDFRAAIERVVAAADSAGKAAGIMVSTPEA